MPLVGASIASVDGVYPASVSTCCAAAPAPGTSVPFIAMNSTPLVSGGGVGAAEDEVGGGGDDGEGCPPPPVTDGVGLSVAAVVPESAKPFARTARPTTISATITRTRPVLRFTRASYLSRSGEAAPGLQGDAESLRGPALAPQRSQPAQPPDQHRVVGQRRRTVDRPMQELVVARRREPERLADRTVLRDLQAP